MKKILVLVLVAMMLLAGCGTPKAEPTSAPAQAPTDAPVAVEAPTDAPAPTEAPTEVPAPTAVPTYFTTGYSLVMAAGGDVEVAYMQTGPTSWIEKGNESFYFHETQRDDTSIYLRDDSRGVDIQLDLVNKVVNYNDGSQQIPGLYPITSAEVVEVQGNFKPLTDKLMEVGDITWNNQSQEVLTLSYVSVEGDEVPFATLNPGDAPTFGPAYFVGVNIVRDAAGNIVLVYVIPASGDQTVTITKEMTALAKTYPQLTYPVLFSIHSEKAITLQFKNLSNSVLTMNWVDFEGKEVSYGSVNPGDVFELESFLTHPWVLRDEAGNVVSIYIVTGDSTQTVTIPAEAVDFWK